MTSHQHSRAGEVAVSGGRMTSGMTRHGARLLRPMGPWSPAVHEYLRHLEAAGFDGAPRLLLPALQRCALDEEPSSRWLRATLPALGRGL